MLLTKALDRFRAEGSHEGEATILTELAPLYERIGFILRSRGKALEQLWRCLVPLAFLGRALALSGRAFLSMYLHETPKALAYAEQALPLYRAAQTVSENGERSMLFAGPP